MLSTKPPTTPTTPTTTASQLLNTMPILSTPPLTQISTTPTTTTATAIPTRTTMPTTTTTMPTTTTTMPTTAITTTAVTTQIIIPMTTKTVSSPWRAFCPYRNIRILFFLKQIQLFSRKKILVVECSQEFKRLQSAPLRVDTVHTLTIRPTQRHFFIIVHRSYFCTSFNSFSGASIAFLVPL